MGYSDEEIEAFIKENRELIEKLMDRKESESCRGESGETRTGRKIHEEREKAESMFRDTYYAFTDPEVQKYFMRMGMDLMMGMSALIQRIPGPDFMKNTAADMETSWKEAASSTCGVKKGKINIDTDGGNRPEKITLSEE